MAGTAELAIVIKARDEASGVLNSLSGKAKSLGGSLSSAFRVAGVGAVAGLGVAAVAIHGFVKEAAEAQKIQTQTNAVIASTKGIAGITAKAVDDLSNSLSRVIPIDDELISQTQNMLLTFTKVGKEVFPQATEAALDMATALGGDPVDAALRLGKALNDPIAGVTALRRVGVQLTDAQEEQIKSFIAVNDIAGAQGIILKELQTEFGNSGRAAGETFAGKMKILQTQIGNVKETIGNALIPILTLAATALGNFLADHQDDIERFAALFSIKVVGAIQGVVDFMVRHRETIEKFFESFKTGLETLKPVVEYILTHKVTLVAAILAIGVAIAFALGPVSAAALAIIGIITLIGYLRDNWRDVLTFMKDHLAEFMLAAGIAFGPLGLPLLIAGISMDAFGLRDKMKEALDAIVGYFQELPSKILTAIEGLGGKIAAELNPLNHIPGGSIVSGAIGRLPGFATGGIVPGPVGRPQLAVVHGEEEVLTPGQRGGGVTVNVYADMTDATIAKVARAVEDAANRGLRLTSLQGSFSGGGLFGS